MRLIAGLTLTARLTLLFAAASGAVLLALGWLIGGSIERHFEDLDRDALGAQLMQAQHAIARVGAADDLGRLPLLVGTALGGHHDLMLSILGPDDAVLLASPGAAFPAGWQARVGPVGAPTQLFEWSAGEHRYRGLASALATGIADAPPLRVAVAQDTLHHQVFMRSFTQTLWLFVVCAAAATGLLGWFAASRGLAPLRDMRARAAQVTAHKLDQRLPVDAVPPELADLARSLNEMLAGLEEAFLRLSDFSSDIAHELRTPVSNLMTQTQVALSRVRDAASYRTILESNAEELERLARMIADMLYLAKAENGLASSLLHGAAPVDLAQEVRELFEFYEALAEERGVRLVLSGQARAHGDRLMLRRAISNLLSNALRHTPAGAAVTLRLSCAAGQVLLEVENPGTTIAPQHLGRLFERFYRGDPSRQHGPGEGTGLGLAITQAIVIAHHGHVAVTSAQGLTCFSLRLPEAV
ncbi:MAG: heavy metal sensor histidine kinase [Rhodoferax sp.]